MKRKVLPGSVLLLLLTLLLTQCNDHYGRYEDPPWLDGSHIETMEEKGVYNSFLALMDKADYRNSIEKYLYAIFAPTDSAFEEYFKRANISGIDAMSRKEAEALFSQHLLVNPRSREQLMYEYAWDELQDAKGEYGTLFHRKETSSDPEEYTEMVRYNEEFKDQELKLYRRNIMIPFWTTEFFEDYFGDTEGADYLFMYPESSWSGTQWHSAKVEGTLRTSSGFIYQIDRVVDPVQSIELYLKNNEDEFGLFYDIAQRYAHYTDRRLNEKDEPVYRKTYNQIMDIADDWGPNPSTPANMLYSFSAYIPTNDVLQSYLNNTVLQSYTSIDSVPDVFLVYLLQSHLNSILTLPSKMQDRFLNYYGDRIDLDIDADIKGAKMCGNGIVYAMNKVLEPNAFSCVPGPVIYNSDYTTFMYAMQESGVLNILTNPDVNVILFAPDNDELLEYGIRASEDEGDVTIQIRNSVGVWEDMETLDIEKFVLDYVHIGDMADLGGEGFLQMASYNFVYYNNNRLQGGGNQIVGDESAIVESMLQKNGTLNFVDNSINAPVTAAELILEDPELSMFAALLDSASLIDSVQYHYEQEGVKYPRISFMTDLSEWTVLAPTNQAISDAVLAGVIPEDNDELKDFLKYHFVRENAVFDDGVKSGTFLTQRIREIIGSDIYFSSLDFTNSINNLSIQDGSGQVLAVDHADANILVEGGVMHKIEGVLLPIPAK